MADEPRSGGRIEWKLVFGAIGAVLSLAAFFGVNRWSDVASAFGSGGTPATTAGVTPSPHPAPTQKSKPRPKPKPTCTFACHKASFEPPNPEADGTCSSDSRCTLTSTFINYGAAAGNASAVFSLAATLDDEMNGRYLGTCTAIIPVTPPHETTSASCVINFPATPGTLYPGKIVVVNP
ncbi:hypothetical protein ABH931_005022 [Streptacidiphilus sp. MAP12-33]|uniref:hypothetical protein n=1 Tax=Streptacidiphilus sp. MAP12-33 TaxID=3156266 RepID=UPI003510D8A1